MLANLDALLRAYADVRLRAVRNSHNQLDRFIPADRASPPSVASAVTAGRDVPPPIPPASRPAFSQKGVA